MGKHHFRLRPAQPDEPGAITISALLTTPAFAGTVIRSPVTGEDIPLPGGLREALGPQIAALGGDTAWVIFTIRYTPDPGEDQPPLPPGVRPPAPDQRPPSRHTPPPPPPELP